MSPKTTKGSHDRELRAMSTILRSLEGLDGESIQRVLDYVFGRLSISRPSPTRGTFTAPASVAPITSGGSDVAADRRFVSIRDLKDAKQPQSSNQMAALVAYYLSELAPENERREAITTADLEKYYKQAGFRLPSALYKTLRNASSAGYFDSAGGGRYRLNPVGYNLVVHGLPRGEESAARSKPKPRIKRKTSKR